MNESQKASAGVLFKLIADCLNQSYYLVLQLLLKRFQRLLQD